MGTHETEGQESQVWRDKLQIWSEGHAGHAGGAAGQTTQPLEPIG